MLLGSGSAHFLSGLLLRATSYIFVFTWCLWLYLTVLLYVGCWLNTIPARKTYSKILEQDAEHHTIEDDVFDQPTVPNIVFRTEEKTNNCRQCCAVFSLKHIKVNIHIYTPQRKNITFIQMDNYNK